MILAKALGQSDFSFVLSRGFVHDNMTIYFRKIEWIYLYCINFKSFLEIWLFNHICVCISGADVRLRTFEVQGAARTREPADRRRRSVSFIYLFAKAKGQIISECSYEMIISPKIPTKKFPRFLPYSLRRGQIKNVIKQIMLNDP